MPEITSKVYDAGCSPNDWYLATTDAIQVSMDYLDLELIDCDPTDISKVKIDFRDGTTMTSQTSDTTLNNLYVNETLNSGTDSSTLATFLDAQYFNTAPKTITARNAAITAKDVRAAGVKIFDAPAGGSNYILALGSLAKNVAGSVTDYAMENIEITFSPAAGTPQANLGNSVVATYFGTDNARVGETKAVVSS